MKNLKAIFDDGSQQVVITIAENEENKSKVSIEFIPDRESKKENSLAETFAVKFCEAMECLTIKNK